MTIDHRTLESILPHGSLQLARGLIRRRGGQGGEACETVWMRADRLSHVVVGGMRERHRLLRIVQFLNPGLGVGQNLKVNARLVHAP